MNNRTNNYYVMDLMKFFMAILIVCLHTSPLRHYSEFGDYELVNGICRIAVPFFFCASSFLLFKKIDIADVDTVVIKKYCVHMMRLFFIWSAVFIPYYIFLIFSDGHGFMKRSIFQLVTFVNGGGDTALVS